MSDTIREVIIQDILARAATIRTANGYGTNIGATVERANNNPSAPCVNVFPGVENATKAYGKQMPIMPVVIEGYLLYGNENPSVVSERILGDLIKAFCSPSWSRSPDYIDGIDYAQGGTASYPDNEDVTVGASIGINIRYTTALGDPYNT